MFVSFVISITLFASSSCQDVGSDRIEALEQTIDLIKATMETLILDNQMLKDENLQLKAGMQMLNDKSLEVEKWMDVSERKESELRFSLKRLILQSLI